VHPRVHGLSYQEQRRPRALSLVDLEVPLVKFLDAPGVDDRRADRLAASLWNRICSVADAGLFLADLKPDNVLYDAARTRCYLIDISDSIFMDAALLALLAGAGRTPEQACAQARGVKLAAMALLFYLHLEKDQAKRRATARQARFMAFFQARLQRSCLPLSLLRQLDTEPQEDCFAGVLGLNVRHYFHAKTGSLPAAVKWFWDRAEQLLAQPSCPAVVVAGQVYTTEDVGCGGPRGRHLGLERIGRRAPCPLLGQGGRPRSFPVYTVLSDGRVGKANAHEASFRTLPALPLKLLTTQCAAEKKTD
jgi:hypothetical protein